MMRRQNGFTMSLTCLVVVGMSFFVTIFIAGIWYTHRSVASDEKIRYDKELQELRALVKLHEARSVESEGSIKLQLESLAQVHSKIPLYESALLKQSAGEKDYFLHMNITKLKGTNEELIERIKRLEKVISDLDVQDRDSRVELYHSPNSGRGGGGEGGGEKDGNLRTRSEYLKGEKVELDALLAKLRKSDPQAARFNPFPVEGAEDVDKAGVGGGGDGSTGDGSTISSLLGESTVLLIIASNRPDYLKKTLSYVIKYHPVDAVPIVVSEDGNSPRVAEVIEEMMKLFKDKNPTVPFLHVHNKNTNQYFEDGYWKLCAHFKWALSEIFGNKLLVSSVNLDKTIDVQRVILLEEDLQIAPDFFEYFAATATLLDSDKNLMAVSAWNDNGQGERVRDPKALYRSDFFPGLGWMLNRAVWAELSVKWPKGYWDDWLREPAQRRGRHFIRPEICRTYHFGAHGVSMGQYQDGFLNDIKLADEFVPFTKMDLSYLELNNWDSTFLQAVKDAREVDFGSFSSQVSSGLELKIMYSGLDNGGYQSYVNVARWAGVMDNIKANVPRTAYKGIVTTWKNGAKLHLVPRHNN